MTDLIRLRAEEVALFLDFDGTLVALADHPDAIQPPAQLHSLLPALQKRLNKALAVVSGRPLQQLERHLPPGLALAGIHGGEWRWPGQAPQRMPTASLDPARRSLADWQAPPGVWIEDKDLALAVHYRARPGSAALCEQRAAAAAALADARLLAGKQVFEIKPRGIDKGTALRRFMAAAPFAGRLPVFVGDDVTDEDGFAAAQALGGIGIKVGVGDSRARHRFHDTQEVFQWLNSLLLHPPT
ncbi:trehalose-phosphatase [Stagnimonas aquatica]|uniref:Trehalose 6-phosphate phosphatase n=1 Tax=Stagnimonas aquatica TaxID=2689987 RepID=A0A3N0VJU8_9GAMM|nr:trehalose-phosphatase [Stagnimonas aquatica]ROH93027.1 trehalose-phosphatase [Stagnimonas aquatica]